MTDGQKAKKNMPSGYYVLPIDEPVRNDDLIWDYTQDKFFPVDSEHWLFPTSSIPREEIICVIRKARLENFAAVKTRQFVIKKEDNGLQAKLF